MKLDHALNDLQDAEAELASALRSLAERHAVEHDLYHQGHARAKVCAQHLEALRPFAARYDAREVTDEDGRSVVVETLRRTASELAGRTEATGLVLLRDLRDRYLLAQGVEIDWTILHKAVEAARDVELLAVVDRCHEEAEITAKWLRTRIKVSAAQVLATS